eukprot:scaffold47546_cov28-Tisochrysis_lutea.AAC.2
MLLAAVDRLLGVRRASIGWGAQSMLRRCSARCPRARESEQLSAYAFAGACLEVLPRSWDACNLVEIVKKRSECAISGLPPSISGDEDRQQ